MKQDLHPSEYRLVVFEDLNDGSRFLTRSTAPSDETTKWDDGNSYPLVKVHISSSSHPFYTGQEKLVDVEGRVDRFKARQAAAKEKQSARTSKAKKAQQKAKRNEAKSQATKLGQSSGSSKPTSATKSSPAQKQN